MKLEEMSKIIGIIAMGLTLSDALFWGLGKLVVWWVGKPLGMYSFFENIIDTIALEVGIVATLLWVIYIVWRLLE
ncbi:MAG: hypothetical protein QXQ31_06425 [Zestosphaera sp.]